MTRTASSNRARFRPPAEPSPELLAETQAHYTDRLVVDAFAILDAGGSVSDAKDVVSGGRGDIIPP